MGVSGPAMPGRAHNPQNNAHQSYLQFVKFIFKKVLPHQRQVDREGMQEGGGGCLDLDLGLS